MEKFDNSLLSSEIQNTIKGILKVCESFTIIFFSTKKKFIVERNNKDDFKIRIKKGQECKVKQ